jgi:hypothetical protein
MAGEEPEHFAQYLMQTIARGGNPSTYIMGVPGDIPLRCLEVAGEVTRFRRDNRELYDGLVPDSPVALVRQDRLGVPADDADDAGDGTSEEGDADDRHGERHHDGDDPHGLTLLTSNRYGGVTNMRGRHLVRRIVA